jgi:hypothetical protein
MLGTKLHRQLLLLLREFEQLFVELIQLLLVSLVGISHQLTVAFLDVLTLKVEAIT